MLERLAGLVGFVVMAFVMAIHIIDAQNRADNFHTVSDAAQALFAQKTAGATNLMLAAATGLALSDAVADAFVQGRRDDLQALIAPTFERMRKDHRLTHLYFIRTDRSVLLRVHDPATHDDTIQRYTTLRAAQSGEPSTGIELGAMGTLTLRVVSPWRRNGAIIGYVEFGKELGPLLEETAATLAIHIYAVLDRYLLSPAAWEQGRRLTGRSTTGLEFGGHVLASQSTDSLPDEEAEMIAHMSESLTSGSIGGRTLAIAASPLLDAAGRDLGRLVFIGNRTPGGAIVLSWLLLAAVVSLGAGGLVFLSFSRALAVVERDYVRQHELELQLIRMSAEHQRLVQIEKLSTIGTLIGEVAHQLNNPLVGVINMAQLAERSADHPDKVRAALREIQQAGQSCSGFVKRMLSFTKAGQFDRRAASLEEVIAEAVAFFRQSSGRHVEITFDNRAGPAIAFVDPNLLNHALFNLLTNASEAMGGQGYVTVTLASETGPDQRSGWQISISDNGPGLPDIPVEKLFEPFVTSRKEGTGLGLAVVMHVALLHEGSATARNRSPGGACFAIWIPNIPDPAAPTPAPSRQRDAAAAAPKGLESRTA